MVAMLFVGLGAIGMTATANTTIQLAVPDELRGRVISVYTTVFVGSSPVGALLTGWIASTFGVDLSLAVAGVACVAMGLLALVWLRRIRGGALLRQTVLPPRQTRAGQTTRQRREAASSSGRAGR